MFCKALVLMYSQIPEMRFMYRLKLYGQVDILKRKFLYVKAKYLIFFSEPDRRNMSHGYNFDWLGGHSANREAPAVSLLCSWMLCTPSLGPLNLGFSK